MSGRLLGQDNLGVGRSERLVAQARREFGSRHLRSAELGDDDPRGEAGRLVELDADRGTSLEAVMRRLAADLRKSSRPRRVAAATGGPIRAAPVSEQSQIAQAGVAVFADDDMVVERQAQWRGGLFDVLGDGDVGF